METVPLRPSNKEGARSCIVDMFLSGPSLRKVFAHLCNHASGHVTDPVSHVVHMMLTCSVQMVISEVGVAFFRDHPDALFPFSEMTGAQRSYVESVVIECMGNHLRMACDPLLKRSPFLGGAQGNIPSDPLHGENGGGGPTVMGAHVIMQMGGGCILYADVRGSTQHVHHGTQPQQHTRGHPPLPASLSKPLQAQCHNPLHPQPQQQQQNQPRSHASRGQTFVAASHVFEALCDTVFASRRYGNAQVRFAVFNIIMQRVMGMAKVSREDQQGAYAYASRKMKEAMGPTQ